MQNEENEEQLSPENVQPVNKSFFAHCLFFNRIIMGVRWVWVGMQDSGRELQSFVVSAKMQMQHQNTKSRRAGPITHFLN